MVGLLTATGARDIQNNAELNSILDRVKIAASSKKEKVIDDGTCEEHSERIKLKALGYKLKTTKIAAQGIPCSIEQGKKGQYFCTWYRKQCEISWSKK